MHHLSQWSEINENKHTFLVWFYYRKECSQQKEFAPYENTTSP